MAWTKLSVCLLLAATAFAKVTVERAPMDQYEARLQNADKDCTAIYTVDLEAEFSTQGNDLGMLPTHGKDTRIPKDDPRYKNFVEFGNINIGADWRNYPDPTAPDNQAVAKSQFSVTALTQEDGTPMGFQKDLLYHYHAICVYVKNVRNRWVEVMAESLKPDQQICVSDWGRENLAENPLQVGCGNGELYVCRDSANDIKADGTYEDTMAVKFFCLDSCDDPEFNFYWRITASQMAPKAGNADQQPDGENWCAKREGDDFPSSLLQPYPENYDAPPIFQKSTGSGTIATASALIVVGLGLVRALLF